MAQIRQEINILAGESFSTGSGAIVQLDTTQYTGPTYYFEIVGKVTSGTCTVTLRRKGTSTDDATISLTAIDSNRERRRQADIRIANGQFCRGELPSAAGD